MSKLAISNIGTFCAVIILVLFVACYILECKALHKALKLIKYPLFPWMVWIPVVRLYVLTDATNEDKEHTKFFEKFTIPSRLYNFWWIIAFCLSTLPTLGPFLGSLVYVIAMTNVFAKLYSRIDNKSFLSSLPLAMLSTVITPIVIFKLRGSKN